MADFLRPEIVAALVRWREVAGALALAAAGLWVTGFGGWFFQAVGLLIAVAGAGAAVIALRRLRFVREVDQPGIVEVDEGQVRYFGPHGGGFAALAEAAELSVYTDADGRKWWLIREQSGNLLPVPAAAEGADRLFEAFSSLPGLSQTALIEALEREGRGPVTVWRREARRALT